MSRLARVSSSERVTGLGSKECYASNVMQFIKNERRIVTDSMLPAVSTTLSVKITVELSKLFSLLNIFIKKCSLAVKLLTEMLCLGRLLVESLSVWSLYVLSMPAWLPSGCSSLLPHTKMDG